MKWIKKGQVFTLSNSLEYKKTHASNPLAIHLEGDVFRVFYSIRNEENKSSVSFVDIDVITEKVVNDCQDTIFGFGLEDSFYSHGVSIGNCYSQNGNDYILFMGWQIRGNNHWRGDIGRLQLLNKSQLVLDPQDPFMKSDDIDAISLSYPWVIYDQGIYKMWYGTTLDWTSDNGEMIHVIKYATSIDGQNWKKHGIAIPYEIGIAQAFSRPTVIIDTKGYHMWYSYRSGDGTKYRIGYSFSQDGLHWERQHDNVGIDVASSGWDSEMICYPYVFEHKGTTYMLYNGNDYGKTGFGLAILEK